MAFGAGLPTNALTLAGVTPGAGGLALLDDASADAALTTLGFPTTLLHDMGQRDWRSRALIRGGNFQMIEASAYFVYLGQVARALTPKYVRGLMGTAGTSTQAAEVGLFTTPLPPNGANQTLTPIPSAFKTALDDLTAAGPLVRGNSVAMAVALTVGVHLWAGMRTAMAGNEPIMDGALADSLRGHVLVTTSAGAFDGSTTYAGVVPALVVPTTPVAPTLWVAFD